MVNGKIVLPLVSNYSNPQQYPHWKKQMQCPVCGQLCWLPSGAEESIRKGGQAVCQDCNCWRKIGFNKESGIIA